jgi:hypothetical protein
MFRYAPDSGEKPPAGGALVSWMSATGFRKADVEPLTVDQTMIVVLK